MPHPHPPINVGKFRVFSNKKVKNHPVIKLASGLRGALACCPNLFVRDCRSESHGNEDCQESISTDRLLRLCMRRGCLLWHAQMALTSDIEAWVGHGLGILVLN